MTMMNILEEKGYLRKSAKEKAYVYGPSRTRASVVKGMVKDLVKLVFDGSAEPLLVQLVKDRQLSPEDLEKIARAIKESA